MFLSSAPHLEVLIRAVALIIPDDLNYNRLPPYLLNDDIIMMRPLVSAIREVS